MKREILKQLREGVKLEFGGLSYGPRRKTFKGGNSNAEYNPFTKKATSYNWWTFTLPIKGTLIFNNHFYSMTTSGHQSSIRSLLNSIGESFIELDLGRSSLSLESFKRHALPELYTRLIKNDIALQRKGVRPDTVASLTDSNKALMRQIKTVRKLGATISVADIEKLRVELMADETRRLERARAERQARKVVSDSVKQVETTGQLFSL